MNKFMIICIYLISMRISFRAPSHIRLLSFDEFRDEENEENLFFVLLSRSLICCEDGKKLPPSVDSHGASLLYLNIIFHLFVSALWR